MSLADEMGEDFLSIHGDAPVSVDIGKAHNIPALVSEGTYGEDIDLGGFNLQRTLTVTLRKKDLPFPPPTLGQLITYHHSVWRIASIEDRPPLPFIILQCQQK